MDWHKGSFAGFAPIWVSEPLGNCYVRPRGVFGHVLLPVAEFFVNFCNFIFSFDPCYEPGFPIGYDDSVSYSLEE